MPRPSPLSGASKGAEQLLNAVITRRRLDLEGRRVSVAERTGAMNRLVSIAPFLPRDVPISELPEIHESLATAFPEFDLAVEGGLGSTVLNQSTFDDLVRPFLEEGIKGLSPEEKGDLEERMTTRVALGSPESFAELSANSMLAQTTLDAFGELMKDDKVKTDIFRNAAGLQPIVQFTDPRDGQVRMFDTNSAASIWARLSEQRDYMNFETQKMSSQQMLDVADELIEQLKNHNVSLGRAQAMKILQLYDRSVIEDYAPGKSPLDAYYLKPGQSQEIKTAIEVFTSAARFGDSALEEYLRASPTGMMYMRFQELAERSMSFVPIDQRLDYLESVTPLFPGIATYEGGGWLGKSGRLIFPPIGPEQEAAADALALDPGGLPSMDAIAESMRTDAAAMASGSMTLTEISEKYPSLIQRRAVVQIAMEIIGRAGGEAGAGESASGSGELSPFEQRIQELNDSIARRRRGRGGVER